MTRTRAQRVRARASAMSAKYGKKPTTAKAAAKPGEALYAVAVRQAALAAGTAR